MLMLCGTHKFPPKKAASSHDLCCTDIAGGVAEVSSSIKSAGVAAFNAHGALAVIEGALNDAKNAGARQAGLAAIASTMVAVGVTAEPYLVPLLPKVLELLSDKVRQRFKQILADACRFPRHPTPPMS